MKAVERTSNGECEIRFVKQGENEVLGSSTVNVDRDETYQRKITTKRKDVEISEEQVVVLDSFSEKQHIMREK